MNTHSRPSDLELQVLSVLWRCGQSTAREVLEQMPDGKRRAYTTVLSVMQVMEKKGLLNHGRKGNANVYKPLVSRRQVLGPLMRDMVVNIFGGKPAEAMMHLLQDTDISSDELEEIRRVIDREESKSTNNSEGGK